MLGFIHRNTKNFKNITAIKTLYCLLIRSHLEFSSTIWSPNYDRHKKQTQNVQYTFFKLVCSKLNTSIDRDS